MNYFELFNLPKKFQINKKLLSSNFYKLQSIYHPDLFIDSSTSEKSFILKKSIEINKGYQTLKDFLKRARYLLYLHGFNLDDLNTSSTNNHHFLLKHFFLYEELEIIQKKNSETKFYLFSSKIEHQIKTYKKNIAIELDNNNWMNSINIISELLFFLNIQTSLKKEKNRYLR